MADSKFCRDCGVPWTDDRDRHVAGCECIVAVSRELAPRPRAGARFATREHAPMTRETCERLMQTMSPTQQYAMVADNLDEQPVGTLRALERRGFAFINRSNPRHPFWSFTPLGRRLRRAMHERSESLAKLWAKHERVEGDSDGG
jgi:hypothetical protein